MKFPDPRPWVIAGLVRVVLKGRIWPFRPIRKYIDATDGELGKKLDAIADAPQALIDWLKKKGGAPG